MSRRLEAALAKKLNGLQDKVAKVGWLEGARYTDEGQNISVAEVAVIHEFGAPAAHIPPRPFMRPTIEANADDWKDKLASGTRAVMNGKISAEAMLDQVGALAAGQIRQTISQVRTPPLAPPTVAQRTREGRTDQPLNRTGYMIATLTHVVGEREQ